MEIVKYGAELNNRPSAEKVELNTLLGLAKEEASLVPSLTAMAKEEANQSSGSNKKMTDVSSKEQLSFNERFVMHERHGIRPSNL